MKLNSRFFYRTLWVLIAGIIFVGCSSNQPKVDPPAVQYLKAKKDLDKGLFQEAFRKLQNIVTNYPDTKFANYAYILMGDAQFESGSTALGGESSLNESLIYYESYLRLNPESQLSPYVLFRMMLINHVLNVEGFFTVGADPNILVEIIDNYKRFYLLYPNSSYTQDAKYILRSSRVKLAEYEIKVGDWYFKKKLLTAAAARYNYVLKKFPDYPDVKTVAEKLIDAYQLNQQPYLAKNIEDVYEEFFDRID